MTILAEDLMLLLLDDESGDLHTTKHLDLALAGAMLSDLAARGNLTVAIGDGWVAHAVLDAVGTPPDHPLLAQSLEQVGKRPRTAEALVERIGVGLRKQLVGSLVERGILFERSERTLGVFPRRRWPAADVAHEAQLREALAAGLATGAPQDQRIATLIGLMSAIGVVEDVIGVHGLARDDVRARAEQITDTDWAGVVVRTAVGSARRSRALDIAGEIANGFVS